MLLAIIMDDEIKLCVLCLPCGAHKNGLRLHLNGGRSLVIILGFFSFFHTRNSTDRDRTAAGQLRSILGPRLKYGLLTVHVR
jgi:hypothetical protein